MKRHEKPVSGLARSGIFFLAVIWMSLSGACAAPLEKKTGYKIGTVQYVDLEGGFCGIVAEDGTRYEPSDLDPAFCRDGLRVRFKPVPCEGCMSVRMWGPIVKIAEIREEK